MTQTVQQEITLTDNLCADSECVHQPNERWMELSTLQTPGRCPYDLTGTVSENRLCEPGLRSSSLAEPDIQYTSARDDVER